MTERSAGGRGSSGLRRFVLGALGAENETVATIITTDPSETAYGNEYVQKALDELEAEGVGVKGDDFTPLEIALNEGGN